MGCCVVVMITEAPPYPRRIPRSVTALPMKIIKNSITASAVACPTLNSLNIVCTR
jgi:hypothetical protein